MYALGTTINMLPLPSQEDVGICWSLSLVGGFLFIYSPTRDCRSALTLANRPAKVETNAQSDPQTTSTADGRIGWL